MQRAFSVLNAKSVNDEKRVITGIASTPTADRMSDIVEPLGAVYRAPMPLLLYHKSDKPVGTMDFARPTKTGIPFEASLPNVVEPGIVQDRVNEAYHSLKYKLIAAVSIGFRALKDGVELMKDGGLRFKSWEWLELSLVTVPANPDALVHSLKAMDMAEVHRLLGTRQSDSDAERAALIETIKSADQALRRAVSGTKASLPVVRLDLGRKPESLPGVPGTDPTRRKGVVYLN